MKILYRIAAINEDTGQEIGSNQTYSLGSLQEQFYKIEQAVNEAQIDYEEEALLLDDNEDAGLEK